MNAGLPSRALTFTLSTTGPLNAASSDANVDVESAVMGT